LGFSIKIYFRMNTITNYKRLAIDTIFFNMANSGISRVWSIILEHLKKNDNLSDLEIILLIRGKNIPNNLTNSLSSEALSSYKTIHIPDFHYEIMNQDVDLLNRICKENNINWFISTYYTYCTIMPNILLIHDMIPEVFKMPTNHMWIQKDLAIRNASYFITISETTKRDLIKFYPYIQKENYPIQVIHNSISLGIDSNNTKSVNQLAQLTQLGLQTKKYLMTIATNNDAYKNQALIQSFINKYNYTLKEKLGTPNTSFVIITKGVPGGKLLNNGILMLSDISDSLLYELYQNALCFISPSLYEGFGLPVFEAMIFGIPVIGLDIPIYQELCPGAITYCENDIDDLWDKIIMIIKCNPRIQKRVDIGKSYILEKYTVEKQITAYRQYFTLLTNQTNNSNYNIDNKEFINLIIQSYNELLPERKRELEYCILANLENPYVRWVHDFGKDSKNYLPLEITNHKKYIPVTLEDSNNAKWLTYEIAFKYSNKDVSRGKYGLYWGIINADIFLDSDCNWSLCRGWLNRQFILAQSRHEFTGSLHDNGNESARMDINFNKLLHANTQDGWFYMSPIEIRNCNFEIGMLGCDNAIADRLNKNGYKVINMPMTWKIIHYDIAKGKNSSNYLEKHKQEEKGNKNKPINNHPERNGQYLVPNYDAMMGSNGDIDLIGMINKLGGISNIEKYKVICDMFSSRIIVYNP
jgi:glycosyltransferase involved in cell wall biosynthesis